MPFAATVNLSSLDGATGVQFNGSAAGQWAGWAVNGTGDVNGDGVTDLIVGAAGGSITYVVFGTSAGFPANFDLSSVASGGGFRIFGPAGGLGGAAVSTGDINGDGVDDIMIGAPVADIGNSNTGQTYVIYGRDVAADGSFAAAITASALNGTDGFRLAGPGPNDLNGNAVAIVDDINGDGIDDMVVASKYANGYLGATYVIFGNTGGFGADFALGTLDGANGFRIDGAAANHRSGFAVASAGDINGDGVNDLVTTSLNANGGAGASYVVFGRDTAFAATLSLSTLDGTTGFRINGETTVDNAGFSVASAGDINGDGRDDLIVGARHAAPGGVSQAGASYVVFGQATFASSLNLSTLDGTNGFQINGEATNDRAGYSVSAAGDVNGDGLDDLIIGAPDSGTTGTGAAYVVYGRSTAFAANLNLSALTASTGFRINGEANSDRTGFSVGAGGDLNGDGVDDILVGATYADANGANAGAAYVIFGQVTRTAQAGGETLNGGAINDALTGAAGHDLLNGFAGADILNGFAGNDRLDGGAGADAMDGGLGNDTFFVDNAGDTVTEGLGEGSDRVRASVSFVLGANVDNLNLEGSGDINGTGNALANQLNGNTGANTLNGMADADLIKGGDGNDVLNGGDGNDHLLGEAGIDSLNGGDGNDRLDGGLLADELYGEAGIDILLGGAGDDLLDGGLDNDQLFGEDGADTLVGGGGNDMLDGGAGADAMTGGTGDDIFNVDDAGDTTVEAASQGVDTVRAALSWTLGDNIERLILLGSGDIDGTGNGLANVLTGNAGANLLDGAEGADILSGGLGSDVMIGGAGNDILTGGGGLDRFVVGQESIYSSALPAGRSLEVDTVTDLIAGQGDIIDLSAIDAIAGGSDDGFTLVGAFDGQEGQMTLAFAAGITTLSLDIDGDGRADYQMRITGNVTADSGGWLL